MMLPLSIIMLGSVPDTSMASVHDPLLPGPTTYIQLQPTIIVQTSSSLDNIDNRGECLSGSTDVTMLLLSYGLAQVGHIGALV